MANVHISIPSRGVVFSEVLNAIFREVKTVKHWRLHIVAEEPVDNARNVLIDAFLESTGTHILLLDDDEVLAPGMLAAMVGMNEDVVVADAPAKKTGKSNIFRNKDGEIVATGFGCALIKKEVFQKLEKPYFDLKPWRNVEKKSGNYLFPVKDTDKANPWGGEDINFSIKLRDAGFKIKSMGDMVCAHLEYEPFNSDQRAIKLLDIKKYDKVTEAPL